MIPPSIPPSGGAPSPTAPLRKIPRPPSTDPPPLLNPGMAAVTRVVNKVASPIIKHSGESSEITAYISGQTIAPTAHFFAPIQPSLRPPSPTTPEESPPGTPVSPGSPAPRSPLFRPTPPSTPPPPLTSKASIPEKAKTPRRSSAESTPSAPFFSLGGTTASSPAKRSSTPPAGSFLNVPKSPAARPASTPLSERDSPASPPPRMRSASTPSESTIVRPTAKRAVKEAQKSPVGPFATKGLQTTAELLIGYRIDTTPVSFKNKLNEPLRAIITKETAEGPVSEPVEVTVPAQFHRDLAERDSSLSINGHELVQGEEPIRMGMKRLRQSPETQRIERENKLESRFNFCQNLIDRYGQDGFFNLSLLLTQAITVDLSEHLGQGARGGLMRFDIWEEGDNVHITLRNYNDIMSVDPDSSGIIVKNMLAQRDVIINKTELMTKSHQKGAAPTVLAVNDTYTELPLTPAQIEQNRYLQSQF